MSGLSERKTPLFVWMPKHSTKPLCVCSSQTEIKELTGSHIETIRQNIRKYGYYECDKGIAYAVSVFNENIHIVKHERD